MCFTYPTGLDPEAGDQLGAPLLVILTLDPNGALRVMTLRGPRGNGREVSQGGWTSRVRRAVLTGPGSADGSASLQPSAIANSTFRSL